MRVEEGVGVDLADPDDPADLVGPQLTVVDQLVERAQPDAEVLARLGRAHPVLAGRLGHARD